MQNFSLDFTNLYENWLYVRFFKKMETLNCLAEIIDTLYPFF